MYAAESFGISGSFAFPQSGDAHCRDDLDGAVIMLLVASK